jgi:hypothetical protein
MIDSPPACVSCFARQYFLVRCHYFMRISLSLGQYRNFCSGEILFSRYDRPPRANPPPLGAGVCVHALKERQYYSKDFSRAVISAIC